MSIRESNSHLLWNKNSIRGWVLLPRIAAGLYNCLLWGKMSSCFFTSWNICSLMYPANLYYNYSLAAIYLFFLFCMQCNCHHNSIVYKGYSKSRKCRSCIEHISSKITCPILSWSYWTSNLWGNYLVWKISSVSKWYLNFMAGIYHYLLMGVIENWNKSWTGMSCSGRAIVNILYETIIITWQSSWRVYGVAIGLGGNFLS